MGLAVSSKGNISLLLIIITVLVIAGFFAISFLGYTVGYTMDELNTAIQEDTSLTNHSKELLDTKNDQFKTWWDGVLPLLTVAVLISSFFAGKTFNTGALGIIIFIVLIIVFSYVAMSINNAYDEIASELPDFSIADNYPYTHAIMSNIAIIIIAVLAVFGLGAFIGGRGL